MLIRQEVLDGIREGAVTLAFRRWRRPRVRSGSHLRTAIGLIQVLAINAIDEAQVSEKDAKQAGYASVKALLAALPVSADLVLFRIEVAYAGSDPRLALREDDQLTDDEMRVIAAKLARLDQATARGAWTRPVLRLIEEHPARRSTELAELANYPATIVFKRDVRKLKELGLTESLDVGYRLSARGKTVLEQLG